jgi:hypothetical protein
MRRAYAAGATAACALAVAVALRGSAPADAPRGLAGFAPASAARERAVEADFAAIPSPARARDWHRTFTAEPHPAGSERNAELARFIAEEWCRSAATTSSTPRRARSR